MSYTRTYTHTVEGGASATTIIPSGSTLDQCMTSGGTFGVITPTIVNQDTGIKCHLQLDVVRQGEADADGTKIQDATLAELIRSAASEEETTQGTASNVKSVYIRVEFNN